MLPSANAEASTSSSYSFAGFGCQRTGSVVTRVMSSSSASVHLSVQMKGVPFFVRSCRGRAIDANPWMKGHW